MFKLRCSRLLVAGPGLLGLVAGYGPNWAEGWGLGAEGACGSERGWVVERWTR